MSIDLQKLEQKFDALINDPNFVTDFEQWLEGRNVRQNSGNTVLVEGRKPIFHCIMDREKFGLTLDEARYQDMAEEYAIVAEPEASGGLMIYGKYNDEWKVNPWSCRFLVRELLSLIDIRLPPLH